MLSRGPAAPRFKRVLVAGVSTRAAAESAARAGYVVTAIDAFGDLDQHVSVRGLSLPRDFGVRFSAAAAAGVARNIECEAVAYVSSFENHPGAVGLLTAGRVLLGNGPAVLRRVRDPELVTRVFRERGHLVPAMRARLAAGERPDLRGDPQLGPPERECRDWLVKPRNSGGGARVQPWHQGARLPRGSYLQERVDGTPGSIVFVAAGGRAVPLGMSRQLVGEQTFGAAGYQYCGSILAAAGDPQFSRDEALVQAAGALAHVVAKEFGVVGVNGIDFIARDGVPYTIEVNPRWAGSMELVERAYGLSGFGVHAAACACGTLPKFDFAKARRGVGALGKAIVFARRDVTAGDTHALIADASVRDVPPPGTRVPAGRPMCTVFATGHDSVTCYAALERRAKRMCAEFAAEGSARNVGTASSPVC